MKELASKQTFVPDRGDFIWIDFDPQSGREQAGRRPCLVMSPAHYNRRSGLVLVCPLTRQAKGYLFEVPVVLKEISGVILADHIKSMDWRSRHAVQIPGAQSIEAVHEVLDRLMPLLDFES